jgi:tetratricopeptide (TPR) repeat protein
VPAAEALASVAIASLAWSFTFRHVAGAQSLAGYLAVLGQARRFTAAAPGAATSAVGPALLSVAHLRDFANLQLLLVPVALPLAILAVLAVLATGTRRVLAQPWPVTLALASGGYLAAQLAFSPYLGAPRDWDVLAAGAFPIAMLAASLVSSLAAPPSARTRALVAGLATLHALAWVSVNASPAAALARFAELPLPEGQTDFVLGTRALKGGDLREATSRFERVVRDVPTSCPGWFSLGLACEGQGDYARARNAFAHSLAAFERDRRVPKGEILERLGRADWETGRADEAAKAFELAHAERPASLPPIIFLAVRAAREGRPEEVLRWLDPVMPRKAEQPAILMLGADALDALGRSDEANERRREAARLFPNDPAVRAALERRPTEEKR